MRAAGRRMIGPDRRAGGALGGIIVEPLDLHYSRAKLIRLALYSAAGLALGLWAAIDEMPDEDPGAGRRAWLGRLLGPEGFQWLGWALALTATAFLLLYLRRAFGDPVAARADANGVTVNTLLKSRFCAARDIDRIDLRSPMGQPMLEIVPVAAGGKKLGLMVNSLAEDQDEVEAWMAAVVAAQRGGGVGR